MTKFSAFLVNHSGVIVNSANLSRFLHMKLSVLIDSKSFRDPSFFHLAMIFSLAVFSTLIVDLAWLKVCSRLTPVSFVRGLGGVFRGHFCDVGLQRGRGLRQRREHAGGQPLGVSADRGLADVRDVVDRGFYLQ